LAILRLSRLSNCCGVAKETRLASLASEPSSIIHTPQTFTSDSITVPYSIGINIAIAVTLATGPGWSLEAIWIPKVAISTLLTTSTISALRALSTDGAGWIVSNLKACAHSHLASWGFLNQRARALLTVIRCAHNCISIVTSGTILAIVTIRIMVALTSTRLNVAVVRMTVAVAGHTAGKRPSIGLMMVAWLAPLTVLAFIAHWAGAAFDPVGRRSNAAQLRRVQVDFINKTASPRTICAPDPDRLDVGEDRDEVLGPEAGGPAELRILMQAEDIVLQLAARHRIVLLGDGEGYADGRGLAPALNNYILHRRPDGGQGTRSVQGGADFELEAQGVVVTGPLIP
jgi:hypothetical protein